MEQTILLTRLQDFTIQLTGKKVKDRSSDQFKCFEWTEVL